MNLTELAQCGLTKSLIGFGNVLSIQHKTALYTLNDSLTRMATGKLHGRWAFGLPTGTGKTRAIIEWATAVHKLDLPYTMAVSASKIDAIRALKQDMIDNGIPESKIGILFSESRSGDIQPTDDNDDRQFMLVTHQRIRGKQNLKQYYQYKGQPRNLLIYDESLMASDVSHFEFTGLMETFAAILERTKRNLGQHATIHNYVTESKAILEAQFDTFNPFDAENIQQPYLDPAIADYYIQLWEKDKRFVDYLKLANLELRMVRSGKAAIVTYKIVMPEALQNVMILDASFPIRKLVHYDKTIKDAETLPILQKLNVKFDTLKRFDQVDLYRLKSYGGRNSIEKGFKGERQMVKEVVKVLQTIPKEESVLCFVYKSQQKGSLNCAKVLQAAIEDSPDIQNKDRMAIQTWGNETSLNCYAHCQHVFLVGVLHRDETELMGQYFGQVNDLHAAISKTTTLELLLSEKAHAAYQALSRGSCRTIDNSQAHAMKGYLVEIDPGIETELTQVMPGVNWHVWKPFFIPESENLIETWSSKLTGYLAGLPEAVQRVSCRQVRKDLKADRLARSTWSLIVQRCLSGEPSTSSKDIGATVRFALEGQSLVRQSAERYGFQAESVA